jgi:hypothetical protein
MGSALPRRLRILSPEELSHLTTERLLSYRKKCLALENTPEDSDCDLDEIRNLDPSYIWFKSDPRWSEAYANVLSALAKIQTGLVDLP